LLKVSYDDKIAYKLGEENINHCSIFSNVRDGRSEDRIPVRAGFFAPVQNGRGAQPASDTVGTGSFSGGKRPGRGVDNTTFIQRRV
jgi:hypothetical protein